MFMYMSRFTHRLIQFVRVVMTNTALTSKKPQAKRKRRSKKIVPITMRHSISPIHSTLPVPKNSLGTARLIRRFHTLNKELSQASRSTSPDSLSRAVSLRNEMSRLGGLDAYQRASQLGQSSTRGGSSAKWLVSVLCQEGYRDRVRGLRPLRLLDVGAVRPDNFKAQKEWIDVTAIDLNPQHPKILRRDFLKMEVPTGLEGRELFDIVSLSLVLNFVGNPAERGQMLARTYFFLHPLSISLPSYLRLLYIVLPLPCVANSRYLNHDTLLALLTSLGYMCVRYHHARKLAYYLFELKKKGNGQEWPKKLLAEGIKGRRNNFCVVIK